MSPFGSAINLFGMVLLNFNLPKFKHVEKSLWKFLSEFLSTQQQHQQQQQQQQQQHHQQQQQQQQEATRYPYTQQPAFREKVSFEAWGGKESFHLTPKEQGD